MKDIFIACVDGLKGFPEAIETIYPKTQVQLCLVHLMRFSLCGVGMGELSEFQVNDDQAAQAAVEEQQINTEPLISNTQAPLPADKSEVSS